MRDSKLILLTSVLLAGCFLGGGLVWLLLGGGGHGGQAVDGSSRRLAGEGGVEPAAEAFQFATLEAGPSSPEEEKAPASLRAPIQTASLPRAPVRQTLEEFWGPHWPAIEAHLLKKPEPKLDQEWPVPPPFEELVPELERLLAEAIERQRDVIPVRIHAPVGFALPNPLTAEGLLKAAHRLELRLSSVGDLDTATLARAQEAAGPLLDEIDRERRALVDVFHSACLRILRTRRYGRSPYYYNSAVIDALGLSPAHGYYPAVSVRHRGWTVAFAPHRDEHPELERMARERLMPLNEELARILRASLHQ